MKQFVCLKASAGSGKTFALTVRYISLLLKDINASSILTLTFTNKAALEMSERIYEKITTLGSDEQIINEIKNETNLSFEEIMKKKDSLINNFINNELAIYTIDKFINKILREFAGYLNIEDNFLIDVDDEDLMLYKFLNSLSFNDFELLINFSHSHNKKLTTIVTLFKTLDEKNESLEIRAFNIEVLNTLENDILENANIIKKYVLLSTLSNSAKNSVDFNDINSLLDKGKTWLSKDSLDEYSYFKKDKNITSMNKQLEKIKDSLKYYFKLNEVKTLNELFEIFNNFKEFRINYKKDKNSFEFRDITNLVYELLSKHIHNDFLYFRLDAKYNHILIDEFQDTSVLQYKILEPLIAETMSGQADEYKTFFYVGDTKQSIYRFRGGTKELFDWVIKEYSPLLKLEILKTNYRSSINVVSFVNEVFSNINNYEYHNQLINSTIEGCVQITSLDIQNDEKFSDIKKKLLELFNEGINPKNIAILTYTNNDVLELYEYLNKEFPKLKIITEVTSKLINQNNIKACINLINYYYFGENIYKSNFNALMGKSVNSDISLKINVKNNALLIIVKEIVNYYELLDENSIKFIEVIEQYKDIVDFIYEINQLDTPMVNKQNQGLQILTVFKSKGLEFDTVLILDRIKKKNADKSALLFEYDDIYLNNIYYKHKSRINFDKNYENALENEVKLSLNDERNILYVALTRAKNNMIIFKNNKQSVFEILGNNFEKKTIGKLYKSNKKTKNIIEDKIMEYNPLQLGIQDVSKNDDNSKNDNLKAKYFGIATHYCLEMMKAFDIKSLNFSIKLVKSKYNIYLHNTDFNNIYKRIMCLINNEEFINLHNNKLLIKEQSLVFNNEIKIIDLLIKDRDDYIIVDYKTTNQKSKSHINQVRMYKDAIENITNSKNVKSYLVYLKDESSEILEV